MMRPWLIVTGDFSHTGGMDKANLALAERLVDRDIPVHLVCHSVDQQLAAHPLVELHRVPRPAGMHFPASFVLTRTARAVATRLRNAIVVANGGNLTWPGLNWVHYLHSAWNVAVPGVGLRSWKQRIERRVERTREAAALAKARTILCNSRQTARQINEQFDIPEDRVRIVYYGADPERFSRVSSSERKSQRTKMGIHADQVCIAFIGALGDRRKNLDTVFQAWQLLLPDKDWKDALLLVVGQGAQLEYWKQRAAACGMNHSIRFLGLRNDVAQILAACDLLVHPARYEAFGLSPHEALCRGLPALVSASAGVAELFPETLTPLLLKSPDDVTELADKLRGWLRGRNGFAEAVTQLSDQCRARTWDDMADEIIAAGQEMYASPTELMATATGTVG